MNFQTMGNQTLLSLNKSLSFSLVAEMMMKSSSAGAPLVSVSIRSANNATIMQSRDAWEANELQFMKRN